MNPILEATIVDLASDFAHYDRKEDPKLSRDKLQSMIFLLETSVEEIAIKFGQELTKAFLRT